MLLEPEREIEPLGVFVLSVRQCLVRLRKQRTHRAARVHVRTSPQPDGGAKARAPGLRAALWSRSAEAEHGSNETARGGLKKKPKTPGALFLEIGTVSFAGFTGKPGNP